MKKYLVKRKNKKILIRKKNTQEKQTLYGKTTNSPYG